MKTDFPMQHHPAPKAAPILNMTQHALVPDQCADGLQEFPAEQRPMLHRLLTFETLPTAQEIGRRAAQLAEMAAENGAAGVMLGGAPFLMSALERALKARGIAVFYAFSQRRSTEIQQQDGTVQKCVRFAYAGLVEA